MQKSKMLPNRFTMKDLFTANPGQLLGQKFDQDDSSQGNSQFPNSQLEQSQRNSQDFDGPVISSQASDSSGSRSHNQKYPSYGALYLKNRDDSQTKAHPAHTSGKLTYHQQIQLNKSRAKERDERDTLNSMMMTMKECAAQVSEAVQSVTETTEQGLTLHQDVLHKCLKEVEGMVAGHMEQISSLLRDKDESIKKLSNFTNELAKKDTIIEEQEKRIKQLENETHDKLLTHLQNLYSEQQTQTKSLLHDMYEKHHNELKKQEALLKKQGSETNKQLNETGQMLEEHDKNLHQLGKRLYADLRSHAEQVQMDNKCCFKEIEKLLLAMQRRHKDEIQKFIDDQFTEVITATNEKQWIFSTDQQKKMFSVQKKQLAEMQELVLDQMRCIGEHQKEEFEKFLQDFTEKTETLTRMTEPEEDTSDWKKQMLNARDKQMYQTKEFRAEHQRVPEDNSEKVTNKKKNKLVSSPVSCDGRKYAVVPASVPWERTSRTGALPNSNACLYEPSPADEPAVINSRNRLPLRTNYYPSNGINSDPSNFYQVIPVTQGNEGRHDSAEIMSYARSEIQQKIKQNQPFASTNYQSLLQQSDDQRKDPQADLEDSWLKIHRKRTQSQRNKPFISPLILGSKNWTTKTLFSKSNPSPVATVLPRVQSDTNQDGFNNNKSGAQAVESPHSSLHEEENENSLLTDNENENENAEMIVPPNENTSEEEFEETAEGDIKEPEKNQNKRKRKGNASSRGRKRNQKNVTKPIQKQNQHQRNQLSSSAQQTRSQEGGLPKKQSLRSSDLTKPRQLRPRKPTHSPSKIQNSLKSKVNSKRGKVTGLPARTEQKDSKQDDLACKKDVQNVKQLNSRKRKCSNSKSENEFHGKDSKCSDLKKESVPLDRRQRRNSVDQQSAVGMVNEAKKMKTKSTAQKKEEKISNIQDKSEYPKEKPRQQHSSNKTSGCAYTVESSTINDHRHPTAEQKKGNKNCGKGKPDNVYDFEDENEHFQDMQISRFRGQTQTYGFSKGLRRQYGGEIREDTWQVHTVKTPLWIRQQAAARERASQHDQSSEEDDHNLTNSQNEILSTGSPESSPSMTLTEVIIKRRVKQAKGTTSPLSSSQEYSPHDPRVRNPPYSVAAAAWKNMEYVG